MIRQSILLAGRIRKNKSVLFQSQSNYDVIETTIVLRMPRNSSVKLKEAD